jgi:hypothetical protein
LAAAVLALALSGAVLAGAGAAPPATVLYDGGLGSPPEAQGLLYFDPSRLAGHTTAGGATTLDTTLFNALQAGYTITPTLPLTLDRLAGYQVVFAVQILTETHANANRAGFSLIALSADKLGIELGFWRDRVWAQEGGTTNLFTQAEGAAFDTTVPTTYTLRIQGGGYALNAGATPVLAGAVRDYTAFEGFPDVYETPNFLFLGDDTTSARAAVRFSWVAVAGLDPPPTPPSGWRLYLPGLWKAAP